MAPSIRKSEPSISLLVSSSQTTRVQLTPSAFPAEVSTFLARTPNSNLTPSSRAAVEIPTPGGNGVPLVRGRDQHFRGALA